MRKQSEILEAFAPREALDGRTSFYLVGIGGAGMSGLAKMLRNRGLRVSGSDSTASPVTAELEAEGISVRIGHSGDGIQAEDAVILSDAIDLGTSPEVARARELRLPLLRRSQLLGWLLKGKKVIAVTGTHGKTTTTGMIGAGLKEAGFNPTIVLGAWAPQFHGPIVEGAGEWAVVEACEAYDSFHDLDPFIVVLTNLELDHVDFHGSYENLLASVNRFVSRIPSNGRLVYCAEDIGAADVARHFSGSKTGYSLETNSAVLPGRHNLLNLSGAIQAGIAAGVDAERMRQGASAFSGAERRLQVLREGPITVVDDYAHHPTEIKASLSALRERYPERRLIVVYQPHLYSRTAGLVPEFADALSLADYVVMTDIYPAREAPMAGVSSARIAGLITKPTLYVPSRHLLPRKVAEIATPGDLVVGMGAGNIAEFVPSFLKELDRTGPTRVAVIYGGSSSEREVSFHSGIGIQKALVKKGYDAKLYDVAEMLLSNGDLSAFTGARRPDLAFLAVHGPKDEDGSVQGLFELLHIPYTGSNILASALAMDKEQAKQVLALHGLPVPKGELLTRADQETSIQAPCVVKPNAQGSTVGLSFVESQEQFKPAVENAFRYDTAVLVEEWIVGTEITVPVLGDRALPVVEIVPTSGQYDFASKYLPGATDEIIPARLPQHLQDLAQEYGLRAHRALRCEGASRTDMMVRGDDIFILETNTLPGMTGTSLLPNSAKAAGISFEDLVDWMAQDALRRHRAKT